MKNFAKNLRQLATDAEQRLWQQLRNRQVCHAKFRRQHPAPSYIVNFVCLEKKRVIEADGGQYIELQTYDEKRTIFLGARGGLRFWNNKILTQTENVLDVIFRALNEPPLQPSPLWGEEVNRIAIRLSPTQIEGRVRVFISFLFRSISTQSKIVVWWNRCACSTLPESMMALDIHSE